MKSLQGSLLIVDDDEMNRDLLSFALTPMGYVTTTAEDGRQALALVEQQSFDLVLLDVEMPELDGMAVLKRLRMTYDASTLPVIMVTGRDGSSDIITALDLGANDYVTKPIDCAVVEARIRTQMDRKRAEAALRESEERYAIAVRGANDGLWDWNVQADVVYFSPQWKMILGCAEDDVADTLEMWFARVHPEDHISLNKTLQAHLNGQTPHFEHEHRILHQDGTYRWVLSRGVAVRDTQGQVSRMAGSLTDITERKVADGLTGLPNRILFMDRLERAIERSKRRADYFYAVILLDLDRFKIINESLGHAIGDQLLIAIAQRLKHYLRSADIVTRFGEAPTIARLGGDEFTILLDDIPDVNDATRIADHLQQQFASPFILHGQDVFIGASLGIALSTTDYDFPEDLLRDADTALSRAKARGRACHEVFDTAMHARAVARLRVETDLRRALERQEFLVFYQPIVTLESGQLEGFEALVRWQHPVRGLISPIEFIPVAEENGLIIPLGTWVLRTACHQMQLWQQQFAADTPLSVSVNLSGKQFIQPDLVGHVAQVLEETGMAAQHVKLEITESVLMDDMSAATLHQLSDLNIQLSMDDFGTGYSSLSYLTRFPMQILKIDRSFVSRMDSSASSAKIVRAIISLAHDLGLKVVAEGVETSEHLALLRALHCDYGQGYFFSKPIEAEAITTLLTTSPRW